MIYPLLAAAMLSSPQAGHLDQPPVDWAAKAEATLAAQKAKQPRIGRAKNVILFIGDGMDITTVTAGRIYEGQLNGELGEEHVLTFESLPWVGLSKTYNTNLQTPDSAGTASSMLTGQKTRAGVIDVDQTVPRGNCAASKGHEMPRILDLAMATNRSVGVVSTARITHATPATVYAYSADRNWEADSDMPANADACQDIASQLIAAGKDDKITVALGGGRGKFLPNTATDPEYPNKKGKRKDGLDLIAAWGDISAQHKTIWNKKQFDQLDPMSDERVLGLFEPSHMQFDADRADDKAGEPSLAEMTSYAIDRLSQDQDGFFLMVEGGRIDHAHHAGNAARALRDVVSLDAAVKAALEKTDASDTLIIVTADHGHTIFMQGYAHRGNPILGLVHGVDREGNPTDTPYPAADGKPYTTLGYGNGPGSPFLRSSTPENPIERPFVDEKEAESLDYHQQSIVPYLSETHGGQDVSIYARGPMAYLVNGVIEQNVIFHIMKEAMTAEAE